MSDKRQKPWWIKERHHPDLGVFYVAYGQMTTNEAVATTRSIYGYNKMLRFDTQAEYDAKLTELREAGEKVQ